jgi:hypothetical protein
LFREKYKKIVKNKKVLFLLVPFGKIREKFRKKENLGYLLVL